MFPDVIFKFLRPSVYPGWRAYVRHLLNFEDVKIYNLTLLLPGDPVSMNKMPMHIDDFRFGEIVVNDTTYYSDIIVYPDRVDPSWWRRQGHYLSEEDVSGIVVARPDIVIIGTGQSGAMEVPESTVDFLESLGITVCVEKTGQAVELFNKQPKDRIVIGAFHLTC